MQIANISILAERKAMQFVILQAASSVDRPKVITWNVTEIGRNFIIVKIDIDKPEKISIASVRIFLHKSSLI